MGEVYKARDTRLDRTVAIKILSDTLAADPQFRERFDREGRAVSQLTHPHICTLYDVGQHEGTAFLVMEYLDGATLADRLAKGALPVDQALKIAIEIASALDKAHRAGIVHRDLKPGNIMLTKSGAKLLDFGLAKSRGRCWAARGSRCCRRRRPTSPRRARCSGRSSTWRPSSSKARRRTRGRMCLRSAWCSTRCSRGAGPSRARRTRACSGPFSRTSRRRCRAMQPLAPAALDHVVVKCLEKDPDERWQSAHDLHDELAWIASSRPVVRGGRAPSRHGRGASGRDGSRPLAVAVLSAALWIFGSGWRGTPVASDAPEMRLQILTPADASFAGFATLPGPSRDRVPGHHRWPTAAMASDARLGRGAAAGWHRPRFSRGGAVLVAGQPVDRLFRG